MIAPFLPPHMMFQLTPKPGGVDNSSHLHEMEIRDGGTKGAGICTYNKDNVSYTCTIVLLLH